MLTVVDASLVTQAEQDRIMVQYVTVQKLAARPVLVLRAVVESWDMERIVREVY
jgi:hypothetical protein